VIFQHQDEKIVQMKKYMFTSTNFIHSAAVIILSQQADRHKACLVSKFSKTRGHEHFRHFHIEL